MAQTDGGGCSDDAQAADALRAGRVLVAPLELAVEEPQ